MRREPSGSISILSETGAHSVRPQRRKRLKVVQGGLGRLHSLHAGVDGSCQGLLGRGLREQEFWLEKGLRPGVNGSQRISAIRC